MRRTVMLAMVVALVVGLLAPAAIAEEDTFNLTVRHRINGQPLGLDRDLPVDVYANGSKAFTFEKADDVSLELLAGDYWFEVKLEGTDTTVLSLGSSSDPVAIPGGVDVIVTAKRTGAPGLDGIGLKVKIK